MAIGDKRCTLTAKPGGSPFDVGTCPDDAKPQIDPKQSDLKNGSFEFNLEGQRFKAVASWIKPNPNFRLIFISNENRELTAIAEPGTTNVVYLISDRLEALLTKLIEVLPDGRGQKMVDVISGRDLSVKDKIELAEGILAKTNGSSEKTTVAHAATDRSTKSGDVAELDARFEAIKNLLGNPKKAEGAIAWIKDMGKTPAEQIAWAGEIIQYIVLRKQLADKGKQDEAAKIINKYQPQTVDEHKRLNNELRALLQSSDTPKDARLPLPPVEEPATATSPQAELEGLFSKFLAAGKHDLLVFILKRNDITLEQKVVLLKDIVEEMDAARAGKPPTEAPAAPALDMKPVLESLIQKLISLGKKDLMVKILTQFPEDIDAQIKNLEAAIKSVEDIKAEEVNTLNQELDRYYRMLSNISTAVNICAFNGDVGSVEKNQQVASGNFESVKKLVVKHYGSEEEAVKQNKKYESIKQLNESIQAVKVEAQKPTKDQLIKSIKGLIDKFKEKLSAAEEAKKAKNPKLLQETKLEMLPLVLDLEKYARAAFGSLSKAKEESGDYRTASNLIDRVTALEVVGEIPTDIGILLNELERKFKTLESSIEAYLNGEEVDYAEYNKAHDSAKTDLRVSKESGVKLPNHFGLRMSVADTAMEVFGYLSGNSDLTFEGVVKLINRKIKGYDKSGFWEDISGDTIDSATRRLFALKDRLYFDKKPEALQISAKEKISRLILGDMLTIRKNHFTGKEFAIPVVGYCVKNDDKTEQWSGRISNVMETVATAIQKQGLDTEQYQLLIGVEVKSDAGSQAFYKAITEANSRKLPGRKRIPMQFHNLVAYPFKPKHHGFVGKEEYDYAFTVAIIHRSIDIDSSDRQYEIYEGIHREKELFRSDKMVEYAPDNKTITEPSAKATPSETERKIADAVAKAEAELTQKTFKSDEAYEYVRLAIASLDSHTDLIKDSSFERDSNTGEITISLTLAGDPQSNASSILKTLRNYILHYPKNVVAGANNVPKKYRDDQDARGNVSINLPAYLANMGPYKVRIISPLELKNISRTLNDKYVEGIESALFSEPANISWEYDYTAKTPVSWNELGAALKATSKLNGKVHFERETQLTKIFGGPTRKFKLLQGKSYISITTTPGKFDDMLSTLLSVVKAKNPDIHSTIMVAKSMDDDTIKVADYHKKIGAAVESEGIKKPDSPVVIEDADLESGKIRIYLFPSDANLQRMLF